MTVYGPRINVHPDRVGARKAGPNRLLVVHTSEGGEGLTSAENLGSYMTQPGDRPSPSGGRYGSSYQYVTDTDRVLPAVPDDVTSYSAGGANHDGIHICIPGKASQTRAQWLDGVSRQYIRQAAAAMRDKSILHEIPLVRLTPARIVAADWGYCGHVDVSAAYHKSDHTDPGAQFPWDVLAADLAGLTEGDDEMHAITPVRLIDTRELGNPAAPGQVIKLHANVPAAARSALVNLTLVQTSAAGFVTAWASGVNPKTSNVNADGPGQIRANLALVQLDPAGDFLLQVSPTLSTHLVVDVQGWSA